MQASYHLRFQSGHVAHFARVTLDVVSTNDATDGSGRVWVDAQAFDWLKAVYGPNAWRWSVCDDWEMSACQAAHMILSAHPGEWDVCIRVIEGRPADTTSKSVAFAVCMALRDALGLSPAQYPMLQGGGLVFDPAWGDVF